MSITKHLRAMILLITCIPMFQVYSQPTDLVLQDTTIATGTILEAVNSIIAGPNFTIANTGDATFVTGSYIYFKPGIVIIQGGKLRTVRDSSLIGAVRTLEDPIPDSFILEQNYPNPFNPSTVIRFTVKEKSHVTLIVFNVLGQSVATLVNEELPAGYHEVTWDANNQTSNIYFYRLQTGDYFQTKKLVLLK